IFWNPSWFALYFSVAFGLSLGLLSITSGRVRRLLVVGLVFSYVYFMLSSQRGGFISVHAVLLLMLGLGVPGLDARHRPKALAAGVVALALGLAFVSWHAQPVPSSHDLSGIERLFV